MVSSALSWIFPVDSWTVFEFVAVKKIGKELGKWRTKWTARWISFYFSFGKITTKIFTRSVRVKYVGCSPTKVVLNLTELLSSTVWRSFHFLAAKKLFQELHRAEYLSLIKGRTIRKVIGGGEFSCGTNFFFFAHYLCTNFCCQVKPSTRIFFFKQILLFS